MGKSAQKATKKSAPKVAKATKKSAAANGNDGAYRTFLGHFARMLSEIGKYAK